MSTVRREFQRTVSGKKDAFWLELSIRHPTRDLTAITNTLGIQPWWSFNLGDPIGPRRAKHSFWIALIAEGAGASARTYERCLRKIHKLLLKHSSCFRKLGTDAEMELTINHNIDCNDGLLLRLTLYPEFLEALSSSKVALRLQGWSRCSESAVAKGKTVNKSAGKVRTSKV
jgi:hypothetical protein